MPDNARARRGPLLAGLVALAAALGAGKTATADGPPLRWGADAAGGAPYIFGPENKRAGFEVELADYLGAELGRKPVFVNGDWDALPDSLARGNLDIILNGYEYLPDREKTFPSTLPYFIYTLRLIVRKDDGRLNDWKDLEAGADGKPFRVGVLRGSVAERYVRARFGDSVKVVPTREVDETFQLVEGGAHLDATVQDSPAAVYFVQQGHLPKLRVVGEPVSPGYYVILTRKEDGELRERLNQALRKGLRTGKLKDILDKYGLLNVEQEVLAVVYDRPWPPAPGQDVLERYQRVEHSEALRTSGGTLRGLWRQIARAAGMTVALSCCAMPLAIVLGILIAVGRLYGPWFVAWPLKAYVEVLRGTPLLLQMFVLFFLLPQLARASGWQPLVTLTTLPPFVVGVVGLAVNYSAYEAEIYRAGLLAIPPGQTEAALALGMTRRTALWRVVLPQAVRLVVPPVTNDFIALFKDSSICSMILITELTGLYYQNKYDRDLALQLAVVIGALYFLMSYPLALLTRRLERKVPRLAR
jgi:polar amino acid transport system substrate-binding protein